MDIRLIKIGTGRKIHIIYGGWILCGNYYRSSIVNIERSLSLFKAIDSCTCNICKDKAYKLKNTISTKEEKGEEL